MTDTPYGLEELRADLHILRGMVRAWTAAIERIETRQTVMQEALKMLNQEIDQIRREHRATRAVVGQLRETQQERSGI